MDASGGTPTIGRHSHARPPRWRAWLWNQLRTWHWVSSAVSLAGMLLFAFTGITLNHAGALKAKPRLKMTDGTAPRGVVDALASPDQKKQAEAAAWFRSALDFDFGRAQKERQGMEILASLPRPGGDRWVTVDLVSGTFHMEDTDRGWIALLNDLHKGRNTGRAWSLFLDVFAGACVLFCLSGLGLLAMHARRRPMTWPAVFAGILIPGLLALWLVHR